MTGLIILLDFLASWTTLSHLEKLANKKVIKAKNLLIKCTKTD